MLEAALKGYVAGLGDKYTEYLTNDELEDLMVSVNGNYVGIGIYMTKNDDGDILVLLPIEGSPAEEADLQTGDIIKKVDGKECNGLELTDVSNMVKGEEGTKVNLEILRDNKTFSIDVERRKVEIKSPKKGEKLRFVEMADNNAKITLENKERDRSEILVELKEVLGLDKLPRKIETFDISNISGEYMVAGMCVMVDGTIKRNMSRRFKIKTVLTQDDPKCMQEVVTRRLKHSIDNSNSSGFGKLPDAIFADGGITQIRAIKQAVKSLELDIPVFGMVKNDKHQTRALINEQRQEFEISENLMNLITKFQDEVHDTAISYHRKLRDESITKSELDDIKGIGEAKKKALLKYFGSVEKIRNSSIEEIVKVNGINGELAKNILQQLN